MTVYFIFTYRLTDNVYMRSSIMVKIITHFLLSTMAFNLNAAYHRVNLIPRQEC